MCDGCDFKNDVFERAVNNAVKQLFETDDLITNFVIVAEGIDSDGDRYDIYAHSPHQRDWQSKGLIINYLDYLKKTQTAVEHSDNYEDED